MTKRHQTFVILFILIIVCATVALLLRKDPPQQTQTNPIHSNTTAPDNVDKPVAKPIFDKTMHSINDPQSIWIIVNKQRSFDPITYTPQDLVSVGNGQQMRQEAANALTKMFKAASAENLTLQPMSGYRSYQTQQVVYAREVETYGQTVADTQSAKPGHSEHQTGLSIDIGGGGCGIEDCFGNTAEGKWVAANAYKFGFIVRYPESKDQITGYRYEPWHIRYVGKELASEMKKTNVQTLEEFFDI